MIENSRLLDTITSFQGILTHSVVCFGLSIRYFAPFTIFSISTFCTVSVIYSRTFSEFHFCIETRNCEISDIFTESIELSKKRIVNIKNHTITIPRTTTANAGENERINPERTSQVSDPIPKVILLRARIVEYSLGLAWERIYPYVDTSLISLVRP